MSRLNAAPEVLDLAGPLGVGAGAPVDGILGYCRRRIDRWVAEAGGTYGMLKQKWSKCVFGHELCDLLVLDEASQMNLPEAVMAALPMKADAPLIVVGDHRQMPPIVKHDWDRETRRTFRQFRVYESLFDTLRSQNPPMIRFAESFRLHAAMAEFLRQEVYRHDGILVHSKKTDLLPAHDDEDALVAAVLRPDYPLVVVMDQAPPHTSKQTTAFIASQRRLHVFRLPAYSPDWNPDEKVGNHLKHQELKGHQAKSKAQIKDLAERKLTTMSQNPQLLRGIYFRCCVADLLS